MIVSPRQLTHRSEFYYQLSQLTGAGLGLVPALKQLERSPPAHSYRRPIQRVLDELAKGSTLTEALTSETRWLPEFDRTLIEAGERSGRMDHCFRLLSDHYSDRATMARRMIMALAYPVFLFHFFVVVVQVVRFPRAFLTFEWGIYVQQTLLVLVPIYAVVLLLIYAAQSQHGEIWRGFVERVLHPIPILGTARRYLALARLSAALEALISAGVSIIEAWELAASASGSPELRRTVHAWRPLLAAGQTPAEAVHASTKFPDLFANQYASGEISGKLDDSLSRLHKYYQEEGSRKLHAVARWVPLFIYLCIIFLVAKFIIGFYTERFRSIMDSTSF